MPFFGGGGGAASNMVGATSSVAGTAGLVPAPAAGQERHLLSGGATFLPNIPLVRPTSASGRLIGCIGANTRTNQVYGNSQSNTIFSPIFLPSGTITAIGLTFFSQTTGNVRYGIYDSSSGDVPTTLLGSGTASTLTGAAANAAVVVSSLSIAIVGGLYWIALQQDQGNNVNHVTTGNGWAYQFAGFTSAGLLTGQTLSCARSYSSGLETTRSVAIDYTYGAWPLFYVTI
ncbi:MAG: hypothetical protein EBS53_13580 [Bacteroidetes bacterium]|nr:hypothetical protein [Bacteroidota bacterium]